MIEYGFPELFLGPYGGGGQGREKKIDLSILVFGGVDATLSLRELCLIVSSGTRRPRRKADYVVYIHKSDDLYQKI